MIGKIIWIAVVSIVTSTIGLYLCGAIANDNSLAMSFTQLIQ